MRESELKTDRHNCLIQKLELKTKKQDRSMKESELKMDQHNRPIQKSELKTKKQDRSMKESELKMDRHNRPIQKLELDIDWLYCRLYWPIVSTDTIGRSNRYRKIDQSDLSPTSGGDPITFKWYLRACSFTCPPKIKNKLFPETKCFPSGLNSGCQGHIFFHWAKLHPTELHC